MFRLADLGQVIWPVQIGDAEFRVLVNRALARAFASGEAQRLFDKYFAPVGLAFGGDMAVLYRVQSLPE